MAISVLVIALIIARLTGYLPQRPASNYAMGSQLADSATQSRILLGSFDQKVFYFTPQARAIYEYSLKDNRTSKLIDFALPITGTTTSPDLKKLALLAIGNGADSSVYTLDISAAEKVLQAVVKPELLPVGYALRPDSSIVWSPQSAQIAFIAYKDGKPDLFVAPALVPGVIQHLRSPGSQLKTVIWLDEQIITFVTHQDGRDMMYRVNSNGGDLLLIP